MSMQHADMLASCHLLDGMQLHAGHWSKVTVWPLAWRQWFANRFCTSSAAAIAIDVMMWTLGDNGRSEGCMFEIASRAGLPGMGVCCLRRLHRGHKMLAYQQHVFVYPRAMLLTGVTNMLA